MPSNVISPIGLQSIDAATIILGGWAVFDADGVEGALSFIRITNDSDTDVFISYDGAVDHEYVPAGKRAEVYFQANSTPTNQVSKLRKHTIIYVRGTAGVGDIYIAGYYNE